MGPKGIRGFEIQSYVEGDHVPPTYNDGVLNAAGMYVYYGSPIVRSGATSNVLGLPPVNGSDIVTAPGLLGFAFGTSQAETSNQFGVGFATRPREFRPSSAGGNAENLQIFVADANQVTITAALHSAELVLANGGTPPTSPAAMRAKLQALVGTTYGLQSVVAGGAQFALASTGTGIVKYFTMTGWVDSDIADPTLYTALGIGINSLVRIRCSIVSTLSQFNTPSLAGGTLQTTNRTAPPEINTTYPIVVG